MKNNCFLKNSLCLLILLVLFGLIISGCDTNSTKTYQYAEIYLNCENYSSVQNDPGNCMVIDGTTDGLRIQLGMIVTKNEVTSLMKDLGWKKESQTTKFIDVNGQSYKVDLYKFSRQLD